ncbi:techylectin-5B-like [Pollicipes pollicipes]|uniref:techylectin-5B-like n=1 Tax=Pollicipes pollicipes TaxID=41117 RepID=UPI001884F4FD|nr:techylectin-5B-like [Pollicipes pollicipes]
MTAVDWSPPAAAVYASWPADSACHCRHLCLVDRGCAAAELVPAGGGLHCRLASRRGGSTAASTALAAFVRNGRAALGEHCLSADECWRGELGASCQQGVCACASPQLTTLGCCVIDGCSRLLDRGINSSGPYVMTMRGMSSAWVFCDMETAGGGWTVFQRRGDDTEQLDFYRDWQSYRDGFGNVSGQFWLGNELLHRLTYGEPQELRIELEDFDGDKRFARYASFIVDSEADQYRLHLGNFTGDVGDSMAYASEQQFSTKDRDNDASAGIDCANHFFGGWWYNACHLANLNGIYLRESTPPANEDGVIVAIGMSWEGWRGHLYSLKRTEMKTRPARLHSAQLAIPLTLQGATTPDDHA